MGYDGGYIKLWRKSLDSCFASKGFAYLAVWYFLLARTNWKDGYFKGEKISSGQLALSQKSACEFLKMSRQTFRTILCNLEAYGMISTRGLTSRFTIITICNWDTYQVNEQHDNQQNNQTLTNHQPNTNQTLTMNEEGKKDKKVRKQQPSSSADGSKPSSPNVWGMWVDANRRAGRKDPIAIGKDLGAAKAIGKAVASTKIPALFDRYLADKDQYLVRQGNPLSLFLGRVNAYENSVRVRDQREQEEFDAAKEHIAKGDYERMEAYALSDASISLRKAPPRDSDCCGGVIHALGASDQGAPSLLPAGSDVDDLDILQ